MASGVAVSAGKPVGPYASLWERLCDQGLHQQPPDMYSAAILASVENSNAERDLARRYKACAKMMVSPLASMRIEGLNRALRLLMDEHLRASVEATAATTTATTMAAKGQNGGAGVPGLGGEMMDEVLLAASVAPYDALRHEVLPQRGSAGPVSGPSPSWEVLQRAMQGLDLVSPLFHRVLVPRAGARGLINRGMPVVVNLGEDEALHWTTLRAPEDQWPAGGDATHAASPTSAVKPPRASPPLLQRLTSVTYAEQELALRLLQGLGLSVYHQRSTVADSCFLHYATETFQGYLQHTEALYHRWRRGRGATTAGERVEDGGPTQRAALPAEIGIDHAQERVLLAMIDAVEAVCHYHPSCLTRLVQTGGVPALLQLAYSPCVSVAIRATVLDVLSVLLQEVTPCRRAVMGGGRDVGAMPGSPRMGGGGGGGGVAVVGAAEEEGDGEDPLLPTMVQYALTGLDPSGQARDGPLPYALNRSSASKLDSALRDWFSKHGLSHVVTAVMDLRSSRELAAASMSAPKAELLRLRQRAGPLREKKIQALLQAMDGKRAELKVHPDGLR